MPRSPWLFQRRVLERVAPTAASALHTTLRYRLRTSTAFHSKGVLEEHLESAARVLAFDPARGKMAEENKAFLRDSAGVARCEHVKATPRDTWARVDDYLTLSLIGNDPVLEAALEASAVAGLPNIHISPTQGRLLQLLAQAQGARRTLELSDLARNKLTLPDAYFSQDLADEQLIELKGMVMGYAEAGGSGWGFHKPRRLPEHLTDVYQVSPRNPRVGITSTSGISWMGLFFITIRRGFSRRSSPRRR